MKRRDIPYTLATCEDLDIALAMADFFNKADSETDTLRFIVHEALEGYGYSITAINKSGYKSKKRNVDESTP